MRLSGAEAGFLHIIDNSRLIVVLKQDRREIFHAAAEAQRIADYILAFHPDYAEKPADPADDDDGVDDRRSPGRLRGGRRVLRVTACEADIGRFASPSAR